VFLVAGLIGLMVFYVVTGIPNVKPQRFVPFMTKGIPAMLKTGGFIFVTYAGLLKIGSVTEEVKNPGETIPLAMILSLTVVSILYALMVFVTIGVLEKEVLDNSLTPISDGANAFLGFPGQLMMGIAAILAFLSTANAGIMTAARSLIPLSSDTLIPSFFSRINKKFHTPHNALIITGIFIILSLFLHLDILVEAASLVLILTNILACLSLIILRESRLQNYRPQFRAPLYPWMQLAGIIGTGALIVEMGFEAIIISLILIACGFFIYWFFGRIRGSREYALLHLVKRIMAKEFHGTVLETELREIIRERDNIIKDRFDEVIEQAIVLDIDQKMNMEDFFRLAAENLAKPLERNASELFNLFLKRENESSTAITPDISIPHIIIEDEIPFSILMARAKKGIFFTDNACAIRTVFLLAGSKCDRNFHLICLTAIAQVIQDPLFKERWYAAKNKEALRDIILLSERRR
jgi:APA family basic amino acid/polyamine antiporter